MRLLVEKMQENASVVDKTSQTARKAGRLANDVMEDVKTKKVPGTGTSTAIASPKAMV